MGYGVITVSKLGLLGYIRLLSNMSYMTILVIWSMSYMAI